MKELIKVEVVYAMPSEQTVLRVELEKGSTLSEAIEASGIVSSHPDIELDASRVGIFGRKATLDQVLSDGDRVEIYRPLLIDPKEARRLKAEKDALKAANKSSGAA